MKKSVYSIILGLLLITGVMCTSTIEAKAETSLDDMDYNLNSLIDIEDLTKLAVKYNVASDNSKWESKYDLNGDNIIDIYDIVQMNKEMGNETPTTHDNKDITSKFTDENFKTVIYTLIGKTSSAPILYSDVKGIEKLEILSNNISDLSGIEYFTTLTKIYSFSNPLKTLDVSQNTALLELICSSSELTSLDVSNNTALTSLVCVDNPIKSLDVSKNTALITLSCNSSELKSLDVSKNTALTELHCVSNKLTSLDISKNAALEYLYCDSNSLTSLDVRMNKALKYLDCRYNQLTTFYSDKQWNDSSYKTQYADANHTATNTTLTITADNTDISSKFTDINFKNAVYTLIGKTSPSPILYSDIKGIENLSIGFMNISDLSGIEYFSALTRLYCYGNNLTSLDIRNNTSLTKLDCYSNKLTNLDVSKNTELTFLCCNNNKIVSLDVSNNTELTYLYCVNNELTRLDVSNNKNLINFSCCENQIVDLCSFRAWQDTSYKVQYLDASHTIRTNSLIITIKN